MASRTADATSAIEELRRIENLRADDAVRAEFRIREAINVAGNMGQIPRRQEIDAQWIADDAVLHAINWSIPDFA